MYEEQVGRVALALTRTEEDEEQQTTMLLVLVTTYFTSVSALIASNDSTVVSLPVSWC